MSGSTLVCRTILATAVAIGAGGISPAYDTGAPPALVAQLRDLRAQQAVLHARFRDHAARIKRRHGFDLMAVWEA